MDITPILESLNPAQREAVTSESKSLLVLAGAGSGKTRVLVHRIAWLVDVERLSPQAILSVTFTNKAAREMRERIEQMLGMPTRGMWVGTFHGLAHRLLSQHFNEAGLPQHFQIIDSDDQLRLVKRVIKGMGLDDTRWPPRQAQWFINGCKDEGRRAGSCQTESDPFAETQARIYLAYEEYCRANHVVDFGELLLRCFEMLRDNAELLQHYRKRFRHILVDEFQDTNHVQYEWLKLLAGEQTPMTVVGDDDQSIYGWRGAKVENIREFSRAHADSHTVRLEQNYRSTGTVLQAANAVISKNTDRLGKNLWTDLDQGDAISLYAGFNEQDEARFIAEYMQRQFEGGMNRSEMAVLYRSNAQSRAIEESLLRLKIPYRIYGGQRFYERLEIKNALGYLRLVLNRDDDQGFERVVNTPTRGIGNRTIDEVRSLARDQGISLWQASVKLIENGGLAARACNALQGFLQTIEKLDHDVAEIPLHEGVDHLLTATGLLEFHRAEKGERGQARVDNLFELVSACKSFEVEDEELPLLPQFLAQATLEAGDQQAEAHEDAVQMMTLHSAKGLEFPLVILTGMEENLFPHSMSAEEPGRLEEERRLCYVGITRAMKKLVLSYAESRRLHGEERYNAVSRFVRDIPSELIDEVRVQAPPSKPLRATTPVSSRRRFSTSDPGTSTGFDLGQRVSHPSFGPGVILSFEGQGSSARVQVNFDQAGSKWLVLSYARLEQA